MATVNTHRDLLAWQEGMKLVEMVYKETRAFPREELFGLVTQMRRSAISVPSNIAAGAGRNSSRELAQYLGVASGSLAELATQLDLAVRPGFVPQGARAFGQVDRIGRLVNALRKSIRNRSA